MASLDLTAPFGAWPEDTPFPLESCEVLKNSKEICVVKFSGKATLLVCKEPADPDFSSMAREIQIVRQAGDCSVRYLGRYMYKPRQVLMGLVMSFETVIIPSAIETRAQRVAIIQDLCDLVDRFHARGLVHGDIKPDNLLRCADGTLRFCDFGNSCFAGDGYLTTGPTMSYETANRHRAMQKLPPTREEDYHSVAMSAWEIYTGGNDFWIKGMYFRGGASDDDTFDVVEDALKLGRRPDMARIDDPDIAQLILKHLDLGPPVEDAPIQTRAMCYRKSYRLRGCQCVPECTTTLYFTCLACKESESEPAACPRLYVEPFVRAPTSSTPCCSCHGKEYSIPLDHGPSQTE